MTKEKLEDLNRAILSAQKDYKEKLQRNKELEDKYEDYMRKMDDRGKDLEQREAVLKKRFDELTADHRKLKNDESDVVRRFEEYTEASKTLGEKKGLLEKSKKELEAKQNEHQRYIERENQRILDLEKTAKGLIKTHQEKINELEKVKKEVISDKKDDLKRKVLLVEEELREAQKLKTLYQRKTDGYRDRDAYILNQRKELDVQYKELDQLRTGVKLREDTVKGIEKEQSDRQIYLEALNKKVDRKIEVHKLKKELEVG